MSNIHFEEIIHSFFEEEILLHPTPFGSGHINDTFKFSIQKNQEQQDFILQRINQNIFHNPQEVMDNIQKVALHLAKNNYPKKILSPVLTHENQSFHKTETGEYWRVFPFFKNTFTIDKIDNETQAFEAAKAFGEYLNFLKGLPPSALRTTIPNFHNGVLRLKKFENTLKTATETKINLGLVEIQFIIQHANIFEKIESLKLPIRITHNDTKINNILLDKTTQKAVAVIDLDTLMPGIILSDFGDMVRTFTNSGEEDEADLSKVEMRKDIYLALEAGFLSEMKDLTKLERDHLSDGAKWITLMQAVRFLTDFLEGDPYYKIKYPNHNLVRAKNQIALYKGLLLA
ncbi:MAG: aminoglycoside phosphotransferase family protein [Bacteroidetes bacterium]|jgi:Ser/Thr protein kinase RdoA (MazF antagonist)|nr:aminoglycoside phosphotransferase family protein [Bacteroidota bacterium]MDF1865479.1 aminoglycoside phosphotransferase family protein [Saprospiraceae bacterium]